MSGPRLLRFLACLVALAAAPLAACGSSGGDFSSGLLVTMTTTSVPAAYTGQEDYSFTFTAVFPHPPGTFLVTGGALPPGMNLDRNSGELSGVPRQVGNFTFQVAARDGEDPAFPPGRDQTYAEDRKSFTLSVTRGAPNILDQVLPAAQYRFSYSYQLDCAGGTPPYTFQEVSVFPDGLGAGVTVSPTGVVGGFPTASLGSSTPFVFDVMVTDADGNTDVQTLSLLVIVLPLAILTSSPLPSAAAEFPYALVMQLASLGAGAPYTWHQIGTGVGEVLPPGHTLLTDIDMEITPGGTLQNVSGSLGPKKDVVGPFVPPYSITFELNVTDEANQPNVNRTYTLQVNPGPVLTQINPFKAVATPPFVATGLNFQPGAQLIFLGPGVNQTVTTPTFVNSTTLSLASNPSAPGGATGFVTVRVQNPDGGFFDKPGAFAFPSSNLTFNGTPVMPTPPSGLSSTGLDAADANGDGFCDFVHSGTNSSTWSNASGTSGGVDYMQNAPPGGTFNGAFTRVQLAVGGDWWQVKFADFNTDGRPDVVAVGRPSGSPLLRVWLNSGSATTPFTPGSFVSSNLPHQGFLTQHVSDIALGQFTSALDAIPDLAYVHQDGVQYTNSYTWYMYGGTVSTIQGGASGAFAGANLDNQSFIPLMVAAAGVATGRFNNDLQSDLAVGDEFAHTYWNWGAGPPGVLGVMATTDGSGFLGGWTPLGTSAANSQSEESLGVAVGDVTGDGRDDVLYAAQGDPQGTAWSNPPYGLPLLATFSQATPGSFSELPSFRPSGYRYRYVTTFDGDFDLPLDVAVSGSTNRVDIYRGRTGSTGLQFKTTLTLSGSNVGRVATGDFDNDRRTDVCAAMSFFADSYSTNYYSGGSVHADRGNGSPLNVGIFLNTSP
jgi:hypothetical protein